MIQDHSDCRNSFSSLKTEGDWLLKTCQNAFLWCPITLLVKGRMQCSEMETAWRHEAGRTAISDKRMVKRHLLPSPSCLHIGRCWWVGPFNLMPEGEANFLHAHRVLHEFSRIPLMHCKELMKLVKCYTRSPGWAFLTVVKLQLALNIRKAYWIQAAGSIIQLPRTCPVGEA